MAAILTVHSSIEGVELSQDYRKLFRRVLPSRKACRFDEVGVFWVIMNKLGGVRHEVAVRKWNCEANLNGRRAVILLSRGVLKNLPLKVFGFARCLKDKRNKFLVG